MVQANRIKTVAIVGCTAVGKSKAALHIAERFNGELIGADSMQIYRNFDIGTGKLSAEQCGGITHKLIDVVDADSDFSVGDYVKLAHEAIVQTARDRKLPIIVGGTGLYVYSLLSGCDFCNAPKDNSVRTQLKLASHFLGVNGMHDMLKTVDPSSSEKISANDVKRVIRALEIYSLTGAPKSVAGGHGASPFDSLVIVLTLPRDVLYKRINARVKKMFDDGLIDEAHALRQKYGECGAMQALGYKQIAEHPDMPREEIEPIVAQKTRNYAKRQMTYFNNMKLDKVFIDARDGEELDRAVGEFLGGEL